MKTTEELNKYYELINKYIDDYLNTWKINPKNLKKYLNKSKLTNFLERNGLKEIENIQSVISDVIDDRIGSQEDLIMTFEGFHNEFKLSKFEECLKIGIGKCNIEHEKILADHFDTDLSHINIINSEKHVFEIETFNKKFKCIIYLKDELFIIKENIKNYIIPYLKSKKISTQIGKISIDDIIDDKKSSELIEKMLNDKRIFFILDKLTKYTHKQGLDYYLSVEPKSNQLKIF